MDTSDQFQLLYKVKKFIKKFSTKENDRNLQELYLSPNSELGVFFLNSLMKKKINIFESLITILKDVLYSLRYINHKIFAPVNLPEYKNIVVTWALKKDFKDDGSFVDRYLNVRSNKLKNILWIVIYMDKKTPKKLKDNIVLFKPIEKISFNFLPILNLIIRNIFTLFTSPKLYMFSISNNNFFSNIFAKETKKFFHKNINKIIIPYEGQPFQNKLIQTISKKFKRVETIGYIHSPPMSMPANLIYRSTSPQKIILNGKDQIHCFTRHLGWNKKKILFLPSFRFFERKSKINNLIYLPLSIKNIDNVIKNLVNLYHKNIIDITKFKIKSHPAAISSKKNKIILEKLYVSINGLKRKKNLFLKKNYLIFIGTSSAIIEALERGFNVIQICDNPLIDRYSEKLWPSLKSTKINDNIFIYTLRRKKNMIKFGIKNKNKNLLEKIVA